MQENGVRELLLRVQRKWSQFLCYLHDRGATARWTDNEEHGLHTWNFAEAGQV